MDANKPSRRLLLSSLAATPLLAGCPNLIKDIAEGCPDDPAESGDVTWIPDVAHPVSFGVEALSPATGAPRNTLIYYPAHRLNKSADVLKLCIGRWPVALFLHGMPPDQESVATWHTKWRALPIALARSGYVVVVPNHSPQLFLDNPDLAIAQAMRDIEYVKTEWSGVEWINRTASPVVAGHSFGALLASRVAAKHEVGALVSLGGPYIDDELSLDALKAVTAPSFLMWARGGFRTDESENLNEQLAWEHLSQPRYSAIYEGEHFDYIDRADAGDAPRGPCDQHTGGAAADLVTLFVASNTASLTHVGVDLYKPQVQLTPLQQSYAQGHLTGLDAFAGPGCRLDLRWAVNGAIGARSFGLP